MIEHDHQSDNFNLASHAYSLLFEDHFKCKTSLVNLVLTHFAVSNTQFSTEIIADMRRSTGDSSHRAANRCLKSTLRRNI